MYAQTTLKERKAGKSSVEKETDSGAQLIKEEDIVIESDPAASSTHSDERGTAMSKHVKAVGLLSSVYRVDFRNFVGIASTRPERIRVERWTLF